MRILCSYCSAAKRDDPAPLPAIDRYLGDRLRDLQARAAAKDVPLRILSGEYGLIAPDHPIPWYDHLLQRSGVAALAPRVAAALQAERVTEVAYHTADPESVPAVRPYLAVMEAACRAAGAVLEVVLLPGDPV